MAFRRSMAVSALGILALLGAALVPAPARAATSSTLVDIRAAHHEGYDRLVFEFEGGLPAQRDARYVQRIEHDASGEIVPIVGDATLQLRFMWAVGHDEAGNLTYGLARRTFALPYLIQVVNAGDWEAVLTFGVGLARESNYRMFTLTDPSRIVVDIDTPDRTIDVSSYFVENTSLDVRPVRRPVLPPATAKGALQRLFAGPTPAELAAGLRLVSSEATGFTALSIVDGIARVRLTGGCDSHGSTTTIANQIGPTLKQFSSVRYVKIYNPQGETERPDGPSDSIPFCLEP